MFFTRASTASGTLALTFGSTGLELKTPESAFYGCDQGFGIGIQEFSELVLEFGCAAKDAPRAHNAAPRNDTVRPLFPNSGYAHTIRAHFN